MFSILRKLFLALKKFKLSKSLLLKFLSPGKKIPTSVKFSIPPPPTGRRHYVENPVVWSLTMNTASYFAWKHKVGTKDR